MSYSVLLAARNEEETIGLALEAICNQSLEPSQILVGVNDSSDRTAEIARSFSGVSVYEYPKAGKARTLNKLFEHIANEHLVFTDADVVLFPRACEKVVDSLSRGEIGVCTKSAAIGRKKVSIQPAFLTGRFYGVHKEKLDEIAQRFSIKLFPDNIIAEDTLIDRVLLAANQPCKTVPIEGFMFEKRYDQSLIKRELRIARSSIQLERNYPQLKPYNSKIEKLAFFANRFKERYADMITSNPLSIPRKFVKYNIRFALQFLEARYELFSEDGSWQSPKRNPELLKAALASPAVRQYF